MKDLNDMLVFSLVVESGSFTAAAAKLGIPTSSVSRKVSRLEQQLGVRLLERTTRKHHLSEVGQVFYQHCQRIKEELDYAESSVQQLLATPQGKLRVGTSVSIGQQLISPSIAEFLCRYPRIELELSLTNRRVNLIEEGFDLLIRVGELEDSTLVAKCLGSSCRRLYASPGYLDQHGQPEQPEALLQHDCLMMNASGPEMEWLLESSAETRRVRLKPRLQIDDFSMLADAAGAGLGIAVLPHYIGDQQLATGQLREVLPAWSLSQVNIYALYPSHRGATPKLRLLLEHLTQALALRLNKPTR